MVKDAEAHSSEDKKRKELVDLKNQADQMVYNLEKLLRENSDKIPHDEASQLQAEIDNTKKAAESDDPEVIRQAIDRLSKASHKLTEMMYQQATQQQAAGSQQTGQGPSQTEAKQETGQESEEEVIDAEVVDEDKN